MKSVNKAMMAMGLFATTALTSCCKSSTEDSSMSQQYTCEEIAKIDSLAAATNPLFNEVVLRMDSLGYTANNVSSTFAKNFTQITEEFRTTHSDVAIYQGANQIGPFVLTRHVSASATVGGKTVLIHEHKIR